MQYLSIAPQLRTTDLAQSIRFYTEKLGFTLERNVHGTAWRTRELIVNDDQGHTIYFGQDVERAPRPDPT